MKWEAGKRYYYIIHYNDVKGISRSIGAAIVVPIKSSDNLFPILKIEKIITPNIYLGFKNRSIEGHEISANELQGGGVENHYFDQYEFMKRIFIGKP